MRSYIVNPGKRSQIIEALSAREAAKTYIKRIYDHDPAKIEPQIEVIRPSDIFRINSAELIAGVQCEKGSKEVQSDPTKILYLVGITATDSDHIPLDAALSIVWARSSKEAIEQCVEQARATDEPLSTQDIVYIRQITGPLYKYKTQPVLVSEGAGSK